MNCADSWLYVMVTLVAVASGFALGAFLGAALKDLSSNPSTKWVREASDALDRLGEEAGELEKEMARVKSDLAELETAASRLRDCH